MNQRNATVIEALKLFGGISLSWLQYRRLDANPGFYAGNRMSALRLHCTQVGPKGAILSPICPQIGSLRATLPKQSSIKSQTSVGRSDRSAQRQGPFDIGSVGPKRCKS